MSSQATEKSISTVKDLIMSMVLVFVLSIFMLGIIVSIFSDKLDREEIAQVNKKIDARFNSMDERFASVYRDNLQWAEVTDKIILNLNIDFAKRDFARLIVWNGLEYFYILDQYNMPRYLAQFEKGKITGQVDFKYTELLANPKINKLIKKIREKTNMYGNGIVGVSHVQYMSDKIVLHNKPYIVIVGSIVEEQRLDRKKIAGTYGIPVAIGLYEITYAKIQQVLVASKINGLSLVSANSQIKQNVAYYPIIANDGTVVAKIEWHPKKPGTMFVKALFPWMTLTLGVFVLFGMYVYYIFRKTQRKIEYQEKMIALGKLISGIADRIYPGLDADYIIMEKLLENCKDSTVNLTSININKEKFEYFVINGSRDVKHLAHNINIMSNNINRFKQLILDAKISYETINVKEILEKIVKILPGNLVRDKHVEIKIECEDSVKAKINTNAFVDVISNLLVNVIEHAYIDSGDVVIKVVEYKKNIEIKVQDFGVGIKNEYLDKIFEPFIAHNKIDGHLGIGLHITYLLVTQQLNGNIECSSKEGEGTIFRINIAK